jgi:transglutaminase-like putative cysteine protease
MTRLPLPQLLQIGALAVLWLQLLAWGPLPWAGAIVLPLLLALQLLPRRLSPTLLRTLTLGMLVLWASGMPWGDPGQWLRQLGCLLWIMAGLKLLEARDAGGWRSAALVLLFGLGVASSLSQSLGASLLQGLSTVLCVGSLLAVEANQQPLGGLIRRSLQISLLSLPLVVVALLLLPRLPAVWSLPGPGTGTTGLSESLRPGELASLVQNEGLAARVRFRSSPPPPEQRYWRVLVHQRFDGSGWELEEPPALLVNQPQPSGPSEQQWLVEPNDLNWRPWGGRGLPEQANLQLSSLGSLWSRKPLSSRESYGIGDLSEPPPWQQQPPSALDLAFPQGANPQLEALAQRWRQNNPSPEAIVSQARRWFISQGFRYTLEPGSLGGSAPLDRFLFEQRRGFCEHYAASFSALMRAAGVPSRVVVGYQGGDWQTPAGAKPFLLIRNSDAHAWSEVWLPNRGWVEVDPTSWVVPERQRRNLAASLSARDRQKLRGEAPAWLAQLTSQWQLLDYRWQLWVMGFDATRQQEWLEQWLGANSPWQGLIGVVGVGVGLAIAVVVLLLLGPRVNQADALRRNLDRCLFQLARLGLAPQPGETLQQFCDRAAMEEPSLAPALQALATAYNSARFDQPSAPSKDAAKAWRQLHRQLGQRGRRPLNAASLS